MNTLPRIRSYGDYASSNYGAHSLKVSVGNLTVYFSYETVIAFSVPESGTVVSENVWGPTTGKHLNFVDGGNKKNRLPRGEFEDKLTESLKKYGLV